MHGFENFEATPITTQFEGSINQLEVDIDRKIREYLAHRCGMQEIFTYPWISDEYIKAILTSSEGMLEISAPPSPDERYIRSSMLPNLCKAVADNLRYFNGFAIFESAQIFTDCDYETPYDPRETLPRQRRNVAGACVGNPDDFEALFRKAKGILEDMPRYIHAESFTFGQIEKPVWADNVIWLNISHSGEQIGNLALLSKKASLDCGIKNSAVMLFEIDIDSLKPYPSRTNKFTHIQEYPTTGFDISMLFDSSTKWEEIYQVITGKKDPEDLLRNVSYVDEYRGRQIPEGKKSVTVRLVIGSLKKTLTSNEIENCANAIMKRLKKALGAELRT
jgi:phenylalanyl-tRNA synthetase beta chain